VLVANRGRPFCASDHTSSFIDHLRGVGVADAVGPVECSRQLGTRSIRHGQFSADACSPRLVNRVVTEGTVDTAPSLVDAELTDDVGHPLAGLTSAVVVFKRQNAEEAFRSVEGVADLAATLETVAVSTGIRKGRAVVADRA